MRHGGFSPSRTLLLACSAPAVAFFAAFWLLPAALLLALPARQGWATYAAVITNGRYLQSLLQTLGLSITVTLATLVLGALVGITLARQRFRGRQLLLSLLTLPLSFPGVIVGFFIILLGGRQGVVADLLEALGAGRITFAYGVGGLFFGYLYFSLPRAIATYTAAARAMDPQLEEAARSLGASRPHHAGLRRHCVRHGHGGIRHSLHALDQVRGAAHHHLQRVHQLRQLRTRGQPFHRIGGHHLAGALGRTPRGGAHRFLRNRSAEPQR